MIRMVLGRAIAVECSSTSTSMIGTVLGRAIALECSSTSTSMLNVADYRVRARVLGPKQDQDRCPQQVFGGTP